MEPLKKIQVDGYAMFAEPELLFGNLDELCCVSSRANSEVLARPKSVGAKGAGLSAPLPSRGSALIVIIINVLI